MRLRSVSAALGTFLILAACDGGPTTAPEAHPAFSSSRDGASISAETATAGTTPTAAPTDADSTGTERGPGAFGSGN